MVPVNGVADFLVFIFLSRIIFIMIRRASRISSRSLLNPLCGATTVTRRYAHAPAAFNWEDPLGASNLFTEEELAIQETAKSYCQERMLPRVLG